LFNKKNKYLNIFTGFLIVLSFQVQLELSHSVDYHRDIYSMNLALGMIIGKTICSMGNKYLNIITDILIVLAFQIRLELSHSVDYHRDFYSMNLI